MSQISQLLLYQDKDSELLKIEQEIAGSEERKKYVQTRNFMKKASEKLDQLEAKSKELIARVNSLEEQYKEISDTLKDFEHIDELLNGGGDLSFYQRNAGQIAEELKSLKGDIATLATTAKTATEDYQNLKKKVLSTQKQYPEVETAYQNLKNERKGTIDTINKELDELAKGIDPEILKKYLAKRSERIFPIICEITADRCSKCGIELSIADKDKVSAGNVVECENCHRFLYKKA
ncbi:MAG: zinc ribbon domain-containing protein [Candidatus Coproplasma sp.]